MAKKRRSYPKSANKWKIRFDPRDTSILKKQTEYEGKPFEINVNVKPHKPIEPTIELKERK